MPGQYALNVHIGNARETEMQHAASDTPTASPTPL